MAGRGRSLVGKPWSAEVSASDSVRPRDGAPAGGRFKSAFAIERLHSLQSGTLNSVAEGARRSHSVLRSKTYHIDYNYICQASERASASAYFDGAEFSETRWTRTLYSVGRCSMSKKSLGGE